MRFQYRRNYAKFFNRVNIIGASSIIAGSIATNRALLNDTPKESIQKQNDENNERENPEESFIKSIKDLFSVSKIRETDQLKINPTLQNKEVFIDTLQLKKDYEAPRYPIVLCHGLSGFDRIMIIPSLGLLARLAKGEVKPEDFISIDDSKNGGISLEYWSGIQEELQARGSTVLVAKVPGFGTIEERANKLNNFIANSVEEIRKNKSPEDVYNDNEHQDAKNTFKTIDKKLKVNLIAHSMGGLDARYLISNLEKKNYEVVSLTTVTTPHRGSEVADFVVEMAKSTQILRQGLKLPASINQLTTTEMEKFNKLILDDSKVQYFSYGGCFHPLWFNVFYSSWKIIKEKGGENDGMVSVESSKWGTYLGTLMNVDHLDLINWTNALQRAVVSITPGEMENISNIDTIALYLDIADNLAKRGL
ncbi:hypothetical protein WICMUC_000533 [Wickerhamomyces mucosus]|uniref:AB hydrolase-1 domain-containing protein n=1 Tax=Wickerhamomyces mucosus TaxID=1378264 RepID=A0A9P8PX44_9ASCO|nr:hypothetical protein WICMUC_000533 [Wickerhamomyces mucosus]